MCRTTSSAPSRLPTAKAPANQDRLGTVRGPRRMLPTGRRTSPVTANGRTGDRLLTPANDSQCKKDQRAMRMAASRMAGGICLALATLFPLGATADGVSVNSANEKQLEEGKVLYAKGVEALDAGKHDEAAKRFRESFEVVASPNSRLMLARALIKLDRLDDAYRELEATLALAKDLARGAEKYQKTVDSAQDEMDSLRKKLAFLTVEPGVRVSLDGSEVSPSEWNKELPLKPGAVEIHLEHEDGRSSDKKLDLVAGEMHTIAADLPPPAGRTTVVEKVKHVEKAEDEQAPPSSVPCESPPSAGDSLDRDTVGWITLGVGVAGLAMFGTFTAINEVSVGNVKKSCNRSTCPEGAVDDGKTKGTNAGLSYAGLGIGILGAGIGSYLLLTGGESSTEPKLALQVGPGSAMVHGQF